VRDSLNLLDLAEAQASDAALTGGKGANLARLAGAGFPVPGGFVVTTEAYRRFVGEAGLAERIAELLGRADYEDVEAFEAITARIRKEIVKAELSAELKGQVSRAYASLPPGSYVAVRSSGTAEDLAGASFAGLHDTYLDVRGADAVLDAVKRCWASMWTARATHYRNNARVEHASARIAVVVQRMVEADVAGVLFTANPVTSDTEQMVVNANWGLGESVVSGVATPDSWVLDTDTLAPVDRQLGAKEVTIARDPDAAHGTLTRDTPAADRERFTLDDAQLRELGALGRAVEAHYERIPQDIEWAWAGGELHLLQSRPVTGVELSWDSHVDDWQTLPDGDDLVWTRTWADEQWTGAITPLFYSWRAEMFTRAYSHCARLWGVPEMTAGRMFKFYKAEAYFNAGLERAIIQHTVFPAFRGYPNVLNHVPPTWREEVASAPFSVLRYLRMHLRIGVAGEPANTPYTFLKTFDDWFHNRVTEAQGLPDEQLRALSDRALQRHAEELMRLEFSFAEQLWAGYYLYARDAFALLGWMLRNWYTGTNALAYGELLSGSARRTATLQENIELLAFAEEIRATPALRRVFDAHQGADFFTALESGTDRDPDPAPDFLTRYRAFAEANAHRGQEERDIYFPRRLEDPGMDYRAWQSLLSSEEPLDPEANERQIDARREEALEEVVANLGKGPLGPVKAEAFKLVHSWLLKFLIVRDDERYYIDRSTWSAKRAFGEIGRRLRERGVLHTERDHYFLSRAELYEVLRRGDASPLDNAKIAGRARDFDKLSARQAKLPIYLRGGKPAQLSGEEVEAGLTGVGTSHGTVTGRARVLHSVKEIGRVGRGDILVTNHTDPAWTPVFLVISAIVLETGGMLAHGSLLAREYGFPAVQVIGATELIPDGALITVDGDTGVVHIHDEKTATEQDAHSEPELPPSP
jgi:pyruvate,water dikinase